MADWLKDDPSELLDMPLARAASVDRLHPEFARRINAAYRDGRLPGEFFVVISGQRTYAQQKTIYDAWQLYRRTNGKQGRGLMAANPDYKRRDGTKGSRHQVQPDGHAYALDLDITYAGLAALADGAAWNSKVNVKAAWALLHEVCEDHGVQFPLKDHPRNPERWHAQVFKHYSTDPDAWFPVAHPVPTVVTTVAPAARLGQVPGYRSEFDAAVEMGITTGERPYEPCTRLEAAIMANRALFLAGKAIEAAK